MAILYQDRQSIAPNVDKVGVVPGIHRSAYEATSTIGAGPGGVNIMPYRSRPTEEVLLHSYNPAGNLSKALGRGVDILQGSAYGVTGAAANAVGADSLRDWAFKNYKYNMEDVAWNQSDVPSIGDIQDVGDFFTWLSGSVVEQVPLMLPTVASGGLAVGTGVAARTAANKASTSVANKAFQNYVSKELKDVSFDKLTDVQKTNLVNKFVTDTTTKAALGLNFAQSVAMETGLNWGEVAQELGDPSLSSSFTALKYGFLGGAVESLLGIDQPLLRAITKQPVSEVGEKVFKEGMLEVAKKYALKFKTGFNQESWTELVQETMNILNTVEQVDGKVFLSWDNAEQLANAFFAGGITGGVISSVLPSGEAEPNAIKPSTDKLRDTKQLGQAQTPIYDADFTIDEELSGNSRLGLPQNQLSLPTGSNIDLSVYDEREATLDNAFKSYSQQVGTQVMQAKSLRDDLSKQQQEAQDINPSLAEQLGTQISEIDKGIATLLAEEATRTEEVKAQKDYIEKSRNKAAAGLLREQQDQDIRDIKRKSEPRLSNPAVQNLLTQIQDEITSFTNDALGSLRLRRKELEQALRAETQVSGAASPKSNALRAELNTTNNLVKTLNKEASALVQKVNTVSSDTDLDGIADEVDAYYQTYASSTPSMTTEAMDAKQSADQKANEEFNKSIDNAEKSIKRQQSLIDGDNTISDLSKAEAKARSNEKIRTLETLRATLNNDTAYLEAERQASADAKAQANRAAGIDSSMEAEQELGSMQDAVNQDIERAKQSTTEASNKILEPTLKDNGEIPQPSLEVDLQNTTNELDNIEVVESVEEHMSNDTTLDYEFSVFEMDDDAIEKDSNLSVFTSPNATFESPARESVSQHVHNQAFINGMDTESQQVQEALGARSLALYIKEVKEAIAASNVLTKLIRQGSLKVSNVTKAFNNILRKGNQRLSQLTIHIDSATSILLPVEVQNIVASSNNVLSVYYDGRIFVFGKPFANMAVANGGLTTPNMYAAIQAYKTAVRTVGLGFVSTDRLALLSSIYPDYTPDTSAVRYLFSRINSDREDHVATRDRDIGLIKKIIDDNSPIPNLEAVVVDDLYEAALAQSKDVHNSLTQNKVFTVQDQDVDLAGIHSTLWGTHFKSLAQANAFEKNVFDATTKSDDSSYVNLKKEDLIREDKHLRDQSARIKNVFLNLYKPAKYSIGEENGTYYVYISPTENSKASIKLTYYSEAEAREAINNNSALLDLSMSTILNNFSVNFDTPKDMSHALKTLGIRGSIDNTTGQIVLFTGDNLNLVPYLPNTDYLNPVLDSDNFEFESVIDETPIVSSSTDEYPESAKRRQQEFFEQKFQESRVKLSPNQEFIYNTIQNFIAKFPVLRSKIMIVANSKDARLPSYASKLLDAGGTVAFYDRANDKIVIDLATLDKFSFNSGLSEAGVKQYVTSALVHEAIVHQGFTSLFTEEQRTAFNKIIDNTVIKQTKGKKPTELQTLYNTFMEQRGSAYAQNKRAEEFVAWISESMSLEEIENSRGIKALFNKIIDFIKRNMQAVFSKDPSVNFDAESITLKQIKDSIRASAYKLKQDSPVQQGVVYHSDGTLSFVTSDPVESLYIDGTKFDGETAIADSIAYSSDIIDSQLYALGITNVSVRDNIRNDSSSLVNANDSLSLYPKLKTLATQLGLNTAATVKQAIDKMKNNGISNVDVSKHLRDAGVKVLVMGDNQAISLLVDTTTTFPKEAKMFTLSMLNYIQGLLGKKISLKADGNISLDNLNMEDQLTLVNTFLKGSYAKPGNTLNFDNLEDTIVGNLISQMVTNQETVGTADVVSPTVEDYIEDLSLTQKIKSDAYRKLLADKTRSKIQDLKDSYLDQYQTLKDVIIRFRESYGDNIDLTGSNSPYNLFSTASNKVNIEKSYYEQNFIVPIFGRLASLKLPKDIKFRTEEARRAYTVDLLDLYSHAKHAEERNKHISRISGGHDTMGSGMTTERANLILEQYSGAEYAPLREAAQLLSNMNREILNSFYKENMIDKETYDNILAVYKDYVPLLSDDLLEKVAPGFTQNKGGSGLSVNKKKIIKYATGQSGEIDSVTSQSIIKAYAAVESIQRNKVGRQLLKTVIETNAVEKQIRKDNPNLNTMSAKDIWEVSSVQDTDGNKYKGKVRLNEKGEFVLASKSHKFESSKFDLITVIDENANEVIIAIKDPDLGRALKAQNVSVPSTFTKYLGKVTRSLTKLMTSRNPVFQLVNPIRDVLQATLSVSSALKGQELEGLFGASTKDEIASTHKSIRSSLMKNFMKPKTINFLHAYFKAVAQDGLLTSSEYDAKGNRIMGDRKIGLRAFEKKYADDPAYADLYQDLITFMELGGKTSVIDYLTAEETYIDLRTRLRKAETGLNILEKGLSILDVLSETSETSVRFATYIAYVREAEKNLDKMSKERGWSKEKYSAMLAEAQELSARMALDSTVNFSRRGGKASGMNSWFAFSSAALQGFQRVFNHIWKEDNTVGENGVRLTKYFAALGFGGFAAAYIATQAMGEDEDGVPYYYKIPEYERMNNLIIPNLFGDKGSYLKIPLPHVFSTITSAGMLGHSALVGATSISGSATSMLKAAYSSALPWDLVSEGFGSLIPTAVRPVYQVGMNKTFFGSAIRPESTFIDEPDSQKAWRTTPQFYKDFANYLNEMTGGNQVRSGLIDISPETIEHIASSYGAGLYRLVSDTYALGEQMLGYRTESVKVPVFSPFIGKVGDSGTSNIYYELSNKVNNTKKLIQAVEDNPNSSRADLNIVKQNNSDYYSLIKPFDMIEYKIKKVREKLNETKSRKEQDKLMGQINSLQKQFIKVANHKGVYPY